MDTEVYNHNQVEEKKMMRKIDWKLLPILEALHSISVIDRANISNVRIAGMGTDFTLQIDNRYTIALIFFFPTYFLLELPSYTVLRKVGSANWLALIAFSWGAVMIGQGFVKSWITLAICRVLLGTFEAGFFPGCVYLITCWYVRYETLSGFYLFSVGIGGLANILTYDPMQMEGIGGLRGWRWIFIIEGILTCIVASAAWFIILDFPDKAEEDGFLTHDEATLVLKRIEADRGDSVADPLTMSKSFQHLPDPNLWAFATMYMSKTMPVYAFSCFLPIILFGMGEKYRVRGPVIAIQSTLAIIGLTIVAYTTNNGARYFSIFLGICGCQGNSKGAVASALQIRFRVIGGIIASTTYATGLWVTAGLQFYNLIVLLCAMTVFWRTNRRVEMHTRSGESVDAVEGQVGFKYTM
ncbi:phthalate transporter-like protein [Phaeosphaeriaceae sp. PMI808]|nr:phthalate transporter-like protein [Phaeosphaeriaceae sp. PMI808]